MSEPHTYELIAKWRAAAQFVDPPQAVHDVLDALVAERERADNLEIALDYSNKAREIMRTEKETGWREAERWEQRTEAAESRIAAVRALTARMWLSPPERRALLSALDGEATT